MDYEGKQSYYATSLDEDNMVSLRTKTFRFKVATVCTKEQFDALDCLGVVDDPKDYMLMEEEDFEDCGVSMQQVNAIGFPYNEKRV